MYPDDCIQSLVEPWWVEDNNPHPNRGKLIRACLPHVAEVSWRLVPIARSDPTDHKQAHFRIEPFHISQKPVGASLPVAAFPAYPGGEYLVLRAKVRPAVVLAEAGPTPPDYLRRDAAQWQHAPVLLVAPFYGVPPSATRGGWKPEFVERIRKCEYPQYVWDLLPGGQESILRLDHLQPVGANASSFALEPYRLTDEALEVLDSWLLWHMTGTLAEDGAIAIARSALLGG